MGTSAFPLASKFPGLKLVVQDLPDVIAKAEKVCDDMHAPVFLPLTADILDLGNKDAGSHPVRARCTRRLASMCLL